MFARKIPFAGRIPRCAAFTILVFAYSQASGTEVNDAPRLRVMSFNIHAGCGLDGNVDLKRIAKTISDAKPDLVALQEVDRKTTRSNGRDHLAELGELTDMNTAYGKAIDFGGGEYGVGVLSRFEIVSSKTFQLPSSEGREQRVALEVRVKAPNQPAFIFVSTHFDHGRAPKDRLAQANRLVELFSIGPSQAILAGDLNATPESETLKILGKHWRVSDRESKPTIPVKEPKRKIDYVLVQHDAPWNIESFRVIDDNQSSDHLPIVAELRHTSGK